MSTFFTDVHDIVKLIPRGRVTSYGAIAKYLGTGMSSRMVGWAMKACPPDVPAHRVVNRIGMLTGKMQFASPTAMQELLEADGLKVKNDIVQNFSEVFWDPMIALQL